MRILAMAATALAVIACPAGAAPAWAAEWSVGPAPSDDPTLMAATVRNEDGHALLLWGREVDGRYQVFAELHLARGEAFGNAMPIYRVDGGEAVDTEIIRQEGETVGALWGHVGEAAAFWLIWTSIQAVVLPGDRLHRWFDGKEIEIGYSADDGAERTTRFTLSGARRAILQATGLEAE